MKILITGGAGFIGSHVAEILAADNNEIIIIDDLSTGKLENIPASALFYEKNITDPSVEEVFEKIKPEIMIHLAAQVSVPSSVKNPLKDMEINIKGTLRLLEASVKHGVKKVVFSSTGGAIYGEHDYFPADEKHPLQPLSPYGISKLCAEKYLYSYYKNYGLPYTVLRYSNVYGPKQDPFGEAGVIAIFVKKILNNEQPVINGTGEQTRDFVYVKDVARANLLAVKSDLIGAVNISTGREISINETFSILKKVTGSSLPVKYGPALPGEQLRSVLSYEKAKQIISWSPSFSLEEGLKETVDFFAI